MHAFCHAPVYLTMAQADCLLGITLPDEFHRDVYPPTTIMIRRIPRKYSHNDIKVAVLDCLKTSQESDPCYDLVYLPMDIERGCNRGYAFINFTSSDVAACFFNLFQGLERPNNVLSFCEVVYARIQGKKATMDNLIRKRGNANLRADELSCVLDL